MFCIWVYLSKCHKIIYSRCMYLWCSALYVCPVWVQSVAACSCKRNKENCIQRQLTRVPLRHHLYLEADRLERFLSGSAHTNKTRAAEPWTPEHHRTDKAIHSKILIISRLGGWTGGLPVYIYIYILFSAADSLAWGILMMLIGVAWLGSEATWEALRTILAASRASLEALRSTRHPDHKGGKEKLWTSPRAVWGETCVRKLFANPLDLKFGRFMKYVPFSEQAHLAGVSL